MRILLVYAELATFVRIDLEMLISDFHVETVYYQRQSALQFVKSLYLSVVCAIKADIILSWFGAYHTLIPFLIGRLLGKRCVIIASGYDVANVPELGYGNMRGGIRRWIGRSVFGLATDILAVSKFTQREIRQNFQVAPEKVNVIYHGVPVPLDLETTATVKQQQVLTVGKVNWENVQRKGLAAFVSAARAFPGVRFILIGPHEDDAVSWLREISEPNVEIIGPRYGDDLTRYMREAKVYVQASAYESFGMAVAEAMLCECVPVVTDKGSLPEVVGDVGIVVPYGDSDALVDGIRTALLSPTELGKQCREYVIRNFSYETRKKLLIDTIRTVAE